MRAEKNDPRRMGERASADLDSTANIRRGLRPDGRAWLEQKPTQAQILAGVWLELYRTKNFDRADAVHSCAIALGLGDEFEMEM